MRLTQRVHELLERRLRPGDVAIDATVGNGHDTVALARLVGPTGHVHGFDVQRSAIDATTRRIAESGYTARVTLHLASHETMSSTLSNEGITLVNAVVFNLGYLPGSDKRVMTHASSTTGALDQAVRLIAPDGLVCVMAYRGHAEGQAEFERIEAWAGTLENDPHWQVERAYAPNNGPVLFCVNASTPSPR